MTTESKPIYVTHHYGPPSYVGYDLEKAVEAIGNRKETAVIEKWQDEKHIKTL